MKRWFISDHNKILGEMEERNERERSGGSKKKMGKNGKGGGYVLTN